jgi:uncharacterized delta-60 repeat protein
MKIFKISIKKWVLVLLACSLIISIPDTVTAASAGVAGAVLNASPWYSTLDKLIAGYASTVKLSVSQGVEALTASAQLHPTKSAVAVGVIGTGALGYLTYRLYRRLWGVHSIQTAQPEMVLDETFGVAGKILLPIEPAPQQGNGAKVEIQSDEKIIVALPQRLICYHPSGAPDTTFISEPIDHLTSMALQPDNKIVVIGKVTTADGRGVIATVIRYNPNGSRDTTFGPDGTGAARILPTLLSEILQVVVIQPDGKILVAGNRRYKHLFLTRYNSDGTIDTTFGTQNTGVVEGFNHGTPTVCVLQPDGKIISVSYRHEGPITTCFFVRYNQNGTLDRDFGSNGTGIITTTGIPIHTSLIMQPDGKLLFSTYSVDLPELFQGSISRLNLNGSVDETFNATGVLHIAQIPCVLALRPSTGKILCATMSSTFSSLDCFNPDGSPDRTFGPNNTNILKVLGLWLFTIKFMPHPDNQAIIVGGKDKQSRLFIARYKSISPEEVKLRRLAVLAAQEAARLAAEIKALTKEQCPICMEEQLIRNLEETPCGHLFHPACLQTWTTPNPAERARGLIPNRTCPMCRADLFPPH